MKKDSSVIDRLKKYLMERPTLSVIRLADVYSHSDFNKNDEAAIRAALYGLTAGTPVSKANTTKVYYAVRMDICCPDKSSRNVFLSLPGIPRQKILDDILATRDVEQIIDDLGQSYGRITIDYWGRKAQRRSVEHARRNMKEVKNDANDSCKICDLLKMSFPLYAPKKASACHIISRRLIFWNSLKDVHMQCKSIFSDEGVELLTRKIENNKYHNDKNFIISLCGDHNKEFLDTLKKVVGSEACESDLKQSEQLSLL